MVAKDLGVPLRKEMKQIFCYLLDDLLGKSQGYLIRPFLLALFLRRPLLALFSFLRRNKNRRKRVALVVYDRTIKES